MALSPTMPSFVTIAALSGTTSGHHHNLTTSLHHSPASPARVNPSNMILNKSMRKSLHKFLMPGHCLSAQEFLQNSSRRRAAAPFLHQHQQLGTGSTHAIPMTSRNLLNTASLHNKFFSLDYRVSSSLL
jgi:hypothetical protein